MSDHGQLEAAQHFFAGAEQRGLRSVVVSPGSRSTSLALAVAAGEVPWHLHLDERSAGFAALGEAKASGQPVALVCTSGTAAANYAPAVAEAFESGVPLIIVTADRPPEHIHWGVGQSFDQRQLYSGQLRDRLLMPTGADGGLDHAVRSGFRAAHTASVLAGPVHVNWPFRLPLEPAEPSGRSVPDLRGSAAPSPRSARGESVEFVRHALEQSERPLIVAGPGTPEPEAVAVAARRLGVPVAADVISAVRAHADAPAIDMFGLLADSGEFDDVDLLLRVGDTPTAKSLLLWWERCTPTQIVLDPLHRWHDPSHVSHAVLDDPVGPLLTALADDLAPRASGWLDSTIAAGAARRLAVDAALDQLPAGEAHVARAIGQAAHEIGALVVIASSMPIRDADLFFPACSSAVPLANRGINGIDGVVATAIGATRAHPGRPAIAYLGDIALLHDIGSALDAARRGVELTIVVPNNDGGGIFSFLPIRDTIPADRFREVFHTPHGADFGFLAGAGIDHRLVPADELVDHLREPTTGVRVLEINVATEDHLHTYTSLRALR